MTKKPIGMQMKNAALFQGHVLFFLSNPLSQMFARRQG